MTKRLEGRIAIVTGAGRGIGAATARLFARHGAQVVLASRSKDEIIAVADAINTECGCTVAMAVQTNVSCEQDVENLFQRCSDEFGCAHIVVNNAGAIMVAPVWKTSIEEFRQVMNTNVDGMFLMSRAAFLQMKRSGISGSIIQIGSLAGIRGIEKFPGTAAYAASKHAVVGLTEVLAVEGNPLGIRVNCIAPGAVQTRMLEEAAPDLKSDTKPETIAESILYFADPLASPGVSGAVLEIHCNA